MVKKKTETASNADLKAALGGQDILSAREFLSTGSTLLDYSIANKKNGGIPVGRITEIVGNEASGKSLLAYHIMASTQRRDGIAIYIDIERAADETFMKRMGVDTSNNFIYPKPPKSIEDVFAYIENTMKVVRTKFPNKEKLVTVVWDSIAATQALETVEQSYGEGRITPEARAMSQCFRRAIDSFEQGYITLVCINQLRTKIGVSFGDNEVTPHGKALPFYASTRIKLKSLGKVKEGGTKLGRIIGVNSKATVMKNKVGPSHRQANFPIMFDWGIDDESSFIDFLKDRDIIKTRGAWSTLYLGEEETKFQGTAGWREILKKPGVHNKILDLIDESMIIKFDKKPDDLAFEDSITET